MGKPALVARESVLTTSNNTTFDYASIDQAFPKVDPGMTPCGFVGLFQIRQPLRKTKGGIIIDAGSRSTEHYNTQVAKCVALGPLCFKTVKPVGDGVQFPTRDVLVDWAEGKWFDAGDFVRLPMHGGDRFSVSYSYTTDEIDPDTGRSEKVTYTEDIIFACFQVKNVVAVVRPDQVLKIKAYLD